MSDELAHDLVQMTFSDIAKTMQKLYDKIDNLETELEANRIQLQHYQTGGALTLAREALEVQVADRAMWCKIATDLAAALEKCGEQLTMRDIGMYPDAITALRTFRDANGG